MSTPTTVKFQIAVSSDGNAEKIYNLTLSLLVEGATGENIHVSLLPAGEGDGEPIPTGPGMPIEDPNPGGLNPVDLVS